MRPPPYKDQVSKGPDKVPFADITSGPSSLQGLNKSRAARKRYIFRGAVIADHYQDGSIWARVSATNAVDYPYTAQMQSAITPNTNSRTRIRTFPFQSIAPYGGSAANWKMAKINDLVYQYTTKPKITTDPVKLDMTKDQYIIQVDAKHSEHEFGFIHNITGPTVSSDWNMGDMGDMLGKDFFVASGDWVDRNSANVYDASKEEAAWAEFYDFSWNQRRYGVQTYDQYVHVNVKTLLGRTGQVVMKLPAKQKYTVSYDGNTGTTKAKASTTWEYKNTAVTADIPVKTGYTFTGWNTKANGTGTAYPSKGTVTGRTTDVILYAQYKPNPYTLTFDKNNPTTALVDASDISLSKPSMTSLYDAPWGPLATASKPGYLFQGWYTSPSDGTKFTGDVIVRGNLTVYAHWKPITYTIRFHPNAEHGEGEVTGTMSDVVFTYDKAKNLPKNRYAKTIVTPSEEDGGEARKTPTVFTGWNVEPERLAASVMDEAKLLNLTKRHGAVIDYYAIWDDAPTFVIEEYPDRYFTVEEAQSGIITEEELLRTVVVYDRETNPLPKKDAAEVERTGTDVGVTIVNYDRDEFLNVTDDGVISIRYKVKDKSGNETFLTINVEISRNEKLPDEEQLYYRAISEDYVKAPSDTGGLANDSYWRRQVPEEENEYADVLESALSDIPTTSYDLTIGKTQLKQIKEHVMDTGFGKVDNPDGLQHVWTILGE